MCSYPECAGTKSKSLFCVFEVNNIADVLVVDFIKNLIPILKILNELFFHLDLDKDVKKLSILLMNAITNSK